MTSLDAVAAKSPARSFTISTYHPPEHGWRGQLLIKLAIIAGVALVGASIGGLPLNLIIVPLLPVVLLTLAIVWVLPENRNPPTRLMGVMFFLYTVSIILWPYYLAIQVPGLPLIEIRRIFLALSIVLFLICYSSSRAFREELKAAALTCKTEMKLFWAFMGFMLAAVPFSVDIGTALPNFVKYQIGWTAPFLISIYIMIRAGNLRLFANVIRISAVVLAVIGFFEYRNQGILWANHIPSFLKVSDPAMINLLEPVFRSGEYRVTGPFSVSLSYAEFMAMAMPFFIHYIMEGKNFWLRALAVIAHLAIFGAILLTRARVGLVGTFAAHGIYFAAWTYRKWRQERNNMLASVLLFVTPVALALAVATIYAVPALRIATFGGGAQSASTNSRWEQVESAIPHIAQRPIIGYGPGKSASVLGYRNPIGELSIDSYVLAGALDYGALGFAVMVAMYAMFVVRGFRVGQAGQGELTNAIPAATGIAVWMFIKIALAQEDNVSILYIYMGIIVAVAYRLKLELDGAQKDKQAAPPAATSH